MPYMGPDGINIVEKRSDMNKAAFFRNRVEHVPKIQKCDFSGIRSPCGSATVRKELLETCPNQINSFKRDFKNWQFPKKWNLDGILPVKINFLPKTKMVRMVHMNIFGRMDLGKLEI